MQKRQERLPSQQLHDSCLSSAQPIPPLSKMLSIVGGTPSINISQLRDTPKSTLTPLYAEDIIKDHKQNPKWLQEDPLPTDPQPQQLQRSQLPPTPLRLAISSSAFNYAVRTGPYMTPWRRSEPRLLPTSKLRVSDKLNSSAESSLLSKKTFNCGKP